MSILFNGSVLPLNLLIQLKKGKSGFWKHIETTLSYVFLCIYLFRKNKRFLHTAWVGTPRSFHFFKQKIWSLLNILQFQIRGEGGLNKRDCLTDNLNINKQWGFQVRRGGEGLKNVLAQKWQPVIIKCPKQLLIVEKHQHNFSCSLHLYIKQNRTFLTF